MYGNIVKVPLKFWGVSATTSRTPRTNPKSSRCFDIYFILSITFQNLTGYISWVQLGVRAEVSVATREYFRAEPSVVF
jgi:hypothetical protein